LWIGIIALAFVLCWYQFGPSLGDKGDAQGRQNVGSRLWESFSFGSLGRTGKKVNWPARQEQVKKAMEISWTGYEKYAWGYDEYHPVSKNGRMMVQPTGLGWIIVDALDTLMLMNMTTQVAHARDWIANTLTYDLDHDVNTFETTIRMLGGLLSAHYLQTVFPDMCPVDLSKGGEDLYIEKATDLAGRLLGAFESKSGIPYASINLKTRQGIPSHADGGASSLSEATSVQLEMKYLAKITGEKNFWDTAEKVMEIVDKTGFKDGLKGIYISPETGLTASINVRLGSRGDSYYEYLIKQYLQTSKQEPIYLDMWEEALNGIKKHLITYSSPSNFTVLAERPNGLDNNIEPKMDHLVCFMPGAIALAITGGITVQEAKAKGAWGKKQEADLELAKELLKTCIGMYKVTNTGLAPEITYFNIHDPPIMWNDDQSSPKGPEVFDEDEEAKWRKDYNIHRNDVHNLQRPETVESLFYMYRITGDEKYRHMGWEIFESFIKHTAVEDGAGFSSIGDVTQIPPPTRDNMESFWPVRVHEFSFALTKHLID
jgi:mannosyl-oligosaccharide alpha-1,2-mannosidase